MGNRLDQYTLAPQGIRALNGAHGYVGQSERRSSTSFI
jgi:hypothetical protein